jgi:hypothetical protein
LKLYRDTEEQKRVKHELYLYQSKCSYSNRARLRKIIADTLPITCPVRPDKKKTKKEGSYFD